MRLWGLILVEILKLGLVIFLILSLVAMLMFAWDFEVDACSRFWRWNLIYVWTWTQPSDLLCLWQFLNMYIGYKSCANQYCSPKLDIYPSNYVQIMFEGRAGGLGGGNSVTKPFMRDIPSIKGWNREYWLLIYNAILKIVLSVWGGTGLYLVALRPSLNLVWT